MHIIKIHNYSHFPCVLLYLLMAQKLDRYHAHKINKTCGITFLHYNLGCNTKHTQNTIHGSGKNLYGIYCTRQDNLLKVMFGHGEKNLQSYTML